MKKKHGISINLSALTIVALVAAVALAVSFSIIIFASVYSNAIKP